MADNVAECFRCDEVKDIYDEVYCEECYEFLIEQVGEEE